LQCQPFRIDRRSIAGLGNSLDLLCPLRRPVPRRERGDALLGKRFERGAAGGFERRALPRRRSKPWP